MPRIRTLCEGLRKPFKLPAGDSMSGVTDRPGVRFDSKRVLLPTQPFVKCFINDVEVHASIDTACSMKTFISNKIHNIIDFDSKLIDSTVGERCVSITGGSLNILGHLNANVKLMNSKTAYVGLFL